MCGLVLIIESNCTSQRLNVKVKSPPGIYLPIAFINLCFENKMKESNLVSPVGLNNSDFVRVVPFEIIATLISLHSPFVFGPGPGHRTYADVSRGMCFADVSRGIRGMCSGAFLGAV